MRFSRTRETGDKVLSPPPRSLLDARSIWNAVTPLSQSLTSFTERRTTRWQFAQSIARPMIQAGTYSDLAENVTEIHYLLPIDQLSEKTKNSYF